MKTIKLENQLIGPIFQFLQDVVLKGKASRGRTQLSKRLEEKHKEFIDAINDVRKEYFKTDEGGELLVDGSNYVYKDGANQKELEERIKELNEEEFEIHFGEYATKYESLFTALEDLNQELSGHTAFVYDELMTAYEDNEEEK